MKKVLKYVIISIFCIIILSEGALRLFLHEQLKTQSYPLIYRRDPLMGYSHIPNCNAKICIPSIDKEFTLNNHGFYGKDFFEIKPDSTIRIAIVGNSITEGIWLNSMDSYLSILQKIVNENGYKNIEVINCSMGGVNKDVRNYKHIYYNVSKYDPDIVLFHIGIHFRNENEFRENYDNYVLRHAGTEYSRQYAINMVERVRKMRLFTSLYDVSYIFRAYCKNFYENNICSFSEDIRIYREKTSSAPDIFPYQYSFNTSLKLLHQLGKKLANQRCKLVIFSMQQNQLLSNAMKDVGLTCITIGIKWNKSMFHEHDSHPNGYGHKIIAEQLFNKLVENNYLQLQ